MKNFNLYLLWAALAAVSPVFQSCASITLPLTTTLFGGAELAIRGAELQKELRKADIKIAFDDPFERTWNKSAVALVDLRIQIGKMGTTQEGNGGLIEGRAGKIKIKVIALELTENITEVGIWTEKNTALAELIGDKIKQEVQKQGD